MLRLLVLFSDPPSCNARLRLDKEDKIITALASRFSEDVKLVRQHASQIEDVHALLSSESFDVIHFSGHGDPEGIFLDRTDLDGDGELVSAKRLNSLLSIPEFSPRLLVLLACYSSDSIGVLSDAAPFVVTAHGAVPDVCCLEFVGGFYERLFAGYSIQNSFDHARTIIDSKELQCDSLRLDRRVIIRKGDSHLIETMPDPRHESVWVDLSAVSSILSHLGMPKEEVLHLIAKKLSVHQWIFDVPRDRCIIPIGRLLFGEFAWEDANDYVRCTRLMRLRADVSPQHWALWHKLLVAYNDLASNEYRAVANPAGEESRNILKRAIKLLTYYNTRFIVPARSELAEIGFEECLPYIEFIITHCEQANDQYEIGRYPQAVKSLEEALTNFHELVDGLLPPEASAE